MRQMPSQKPQQDSKQTRPPFSQANPSPLANRDRRVKSSPRLPSRPHPTSPPEHTRISIMGTTSAQSAPKKLRGVHAVSGRVERAGLYFIWAASRSGLQMRARQQRDSRLKTERLLLLDSGAVPAAIYQRILCPRTSTVGARRNWIRDQHPVCHHSRVVKLAHDPEFFPSPVHTPVARRVMPARVLPAG
jgi:hypothetical protein